MADENNVDITIGANPQGVESGSKRAGTAIKGVSKETKEMEAAFRRLKSQIDPTFAAQERYNKSLADAKRLLDAERISQQEFTAAKKAAKVALDQQVASIERNSAAARAAAEEAKRLRSEELAATRQAAQQALQEQRAAAAAKREADRAARSEASARLAEEKAAIRAAAAEARKAAEETKQIARQKSAEERALIKQTVEAEKAARREQRAAVRQAAQEAASAARTKKEAERAATAATREAATEAKKLARAERESADAIRELKASIDPVFGAQERYNETMRRATRLLMDNKLQQGEWVAIQKQAKAQMDINVRSMGRMNSVYVQMGYQAQDVTASLASGISPLVILAQQGGQTAAALSMMGGKVGKVAAFFAGPWGAAIIGATLLLGLFLDKNKDGARATLDLKEAEDRRKMSLDALVESIKKYNEEQEKANINTERARDLNLEEAQRILGEVIARRNRITEELAKAEEDFKNMSGASMGGGGGEATLLLIGRIQKLRAALVEVNKAFGDAQSAVTEARIPQIMAAAEAATDGAAAASQAYYREQTRLYDIFRKSNKTKQDELALEKGLVAAIETRRKAEEAWQESRRKGGGGIEETAPFIMPVAGTVTSGFGKRDAVRGENGLLSSTQHGGIDIAAARGTPVKAPQVGTVESVGFSPSLGKYVVLAHGGGTTTRFGHMDTTTVTKGQTVGQGDQIGTVGKTGTATGTHLHYEVRVNGKAVDPTKGVFAVDRLEAETDAFKALDEARKEALDNYAAEIEFKQALENEDLEQVLSLQDEKIVALREYYGEAAAETVRAERERVLMQRRYDAQVLEEQKRGIQSRLTAAQAEEQTRNQVGDIQRGGQEDVVGFQAEIGALSPQQVIAERARLKAEEYAAEIAHQNRMHEIRVNAIQSQLALQNLPLKQKQELNAQLEALEADHLSRITIMEAQHARDVQRINLETANASLQKWKTVSDSIRGSMNSMFQGIWTHSMTFQDGLIQMADQLVYKWFDAGTRMLQNWIMKQLGMTTVTAAQETAKTAAVATGETARTAATATGAATRVAIEGSAAAATTGFSLTTALADIGASAARAAAGAYAALAGIPIIGPFIAPAAAVGALAAVLGFAGMISAKGGLGEVKGDQIAKVHDKEMILPAWIAEPMRKGLQTRTSAGMFTGAAAAGSSIRESINSRGDTNFYYQPKHQNMGASFDTLLKTDGRRLRRWLKNEMRNGMLTVND